MREMAKATTKKAGKAQTGKAKAKKKAATVYGIDAMVDAIAADIAESQDVPASAKEVTKTAIKTILQTEKALIKSAVAEGDKVQYIGFGGYEQAERSARKGRNPQTGEEIAIAATTVPKFKAGKEFKDMVK
jgi:DNA-binding protein HU-beta